VATNNRNTISTTDAAALAAFISPTSPEILDFARFVAGLSRANRRNGHNENLQYAVWLLESLRASDIHLAQTYTDESEVQFPAETLSFRTGSSRDLAMLFAAGLEGVGINSAFIQTGNEFLVALNLRIRPAAAETLFDNFERILVINDDVWLPLSMSAFNEGFMACWTRGAEILNRAFTNDEWVNFVIVEEAWGFYPPAPLPELGGSALRTDTDTATREFNRTMQLYIEREITPIIRRFSAEPGAANNAALQNRLGILYARAGRIAEAKTAYERAAALGSVPAMTNRGNLALTENDFAAAERWFRQALERDSQNSAARRGMDRIAGSR
jgi:tetratricopeptide (TPR) repeat protein